MPDLAAFDFGFAQGVPKLDVPIQHHTLLRTSRSAGLNGRVPRSPRNSEMRCNQRGGVFGNGHSRILSVGCADLTVAKAGGASSPVRGGGA